MNIAILYICTGKYTIFWKGFHESAEKYLLAGHSRHYFVFTDSTDKEYFGEGNVKIIHQEKLGWPKDTLMRFAIFKKVEDELKKYDYVYFFNANMQFVAHVGEEIFPSDNEEGLTAVIHPGYYNLKHIDYPYERNIWSKACIPFWKGEKYFMGSLNGGKAKEYIRLINVLNENINIDLKKGIVAVWHDESHLNKYLLDKRIRELSPEYAFPEIMSAEYKLPSEFKPKILLIDKNKLGGHDLFRGINTYKNTLSAKPLNIFKLGDVILSKVLRLYSRISYILYKIYFINKKFFSNLKTKKGKGHDKNHD